MDSEAFSVSFLASSSLQLHQSELFFSFQPSPEWRGALPYYNTVELQCNAQRQHIGAEDDKLPMLLTLRVRTLGGLVLSEQRVWTVILCSSHPWRRFEPSTLLELKSVYSECPRRRILAISGTWLSIQPVISVTN